MQNTWMIAAAFAATSIAGAAGAAAQTPPPREPTPVPREQTRPQPPSSTMPRAGADHEFVTKATEGGMKEVELGKLAAQKASNAEVKAFANRMVTDHGKSNSELASVSGSMHKPDADKLTPPAKLATATGADFDRAYMAEMVSAHTATVALYEKQSREGSDEKLKKFATEKLPTVRDHLEKARALQAKVGMPTTE